MEIFLSAQAGQNFKLVEYIDLNLDSNRKRIFWEGGIFIFMENVLDPGNCCELLKSKTGDNLHLFRTMERPLPVLLKSILTKVIDGNS